MTNTKRKTGPKPRARAALVLSLPPEQWSTLKRWAQTTAREIRAAGSAPIPGTVALTMRAAVPLPRRSLQSIAGPIIAALVTAGIIESPSDVSDIAQRWDRTVPAGIVSLDIRGSVPAEKRIGQHGRQRVAEAQRTRWRVPHGATTA